MSDKTGKSTQDTVMAIIDQTEEVVGMLPTPATAIGVSIVKMLGVIASELDCLQDSVGELQRKLKDIEESIDCGVRHLTDNR